MIVRLGLGVLAAFAAALAPAAAGASGPSGAVSGHAAVGAGSLVTGEPELGGGAVADILFGEGPLLLGAALGTWWVNDAEGGLLTTPIGFSSAVRIDPDPVGATFRARAGFAPGASGEGFHAAAWVGVGVYLDFRIDEVISLGVGSDVSFLVGQRGRTDFMPGLVLTFTPRSTP